MRSIVVVGVAWLLAAPVPKEKAREFQETGGEIYRNA